MISQRLHLTLSFSIKEIVWRSSQQVRCCVLRQFT